MATVALVRGASVVTVLSAIIKDTPPPVMEVNPGVPPELDRIIMHCLAKDPADRCQSALDLCQELSDVPHEVWPKESSAAVTRAIIPAKRRIPRIAWISMVLLAVAGLLIYLWSNREPAQVQAEFKPLTFSGAEQFPSLSPDGKWVIYSGLESGHRQIFLQDVGGQTPLLLTKDSASENDEPAFSRDGQQIAFWSNRDGGGIFVMGRTGENVRKVAGAGFNPAWSPDGRKLVYGTDNVQLTPLNVPGNSELHVADVSTGASQRIHKGDAVQPNWSPGNLRIVYVNRTEKDKQLDIYTIPIDGGEQTAVTDDVAADWSPAWSPDGKYIYFASNRGGTFNLWRVRIDETSGKPMAEPEPITTPSQFVGHPCLSADGRLVAYCAVTEKQNIQRIAFDPAQEKVTGEPQWVTFGLRPWSSTDISPDGQWLAFSRTQPEGHLYIHHADGTGEPSRLTNDAKDRVPRWSPDGNWIAVTSDRSGIIQLWKIRRDGSGLTQLTEPENGVAYAVWSEDGSRMAGSARDPQTGFSGTYIFDPRRPWNQQLPEILPKPDTDLEPFIAMSFAPDGERLVGQAAASGPSQSAVCNLFFQDREIRTAGGIWRVARLAQGWPQASCVSKGQEFILIVYAVAEGQNDLLCYARCSWYRQPCRGISLSITPAG